MNYWERIPETLRILILLVLIGLLVVLGGSYLLAGNDAGPAPRITYRVSGTSSTSLITYTQEDGTASEPEFFPLPWKSGPYTYDHPLMVVVTAHNSSQYGTVKCEIFKDGQVWKQDEVSNPDLNASCGGYVP